MNPERLLQNFDRLIDTPDAVPRLRRFILDLAVRGKLVEQNPEEGFGADLLEAVKKRKYQLMLERGMRREKDVEYSHPDESILLPITWTWAYVDDVALVQGGKRLPMGASFSKEMTSHIYIRVTDMKNGTILDDDLKYITPEVQRQIAKYKINKEDLYVTIAGTIGQVGRVPPFFDGHNLTENAAKLVFRGLNPDYLRLALSSDIVQQQFQDKTKQMAQPKLALKRISGAKFPLPPLVEQHRIVAKVNELMKLCDELEAAQAKRERRRDRLVAATLHGLNNGEANVDNGESLSFEDGARFYFNHLPRLTTRPEHIQQLRQTILNLAVRGRLVPQDQNDEPATELLERIGEEKKRLIKEGAIKKEGPLPVAIGEKPYPLRQGWSWCRIQDIFLSVTDGDHLPPPKADNGVPFLVIGNVRGRTLDFTNCRYVSETYYFSLNIIRRPQEGDILYTLVGSYGIPVLLLKNRPFCVQRHIGILRPPKKDISTGYLSHALDSRFVFNQATACATGIAQKTVPLNGLRKILIPLPPLAEQHRIVAKVDDLMVLCDKLENEIKSITTTSRQLLEATLQEALN